MKTVTGVRNYGGVRTHDGVRTSDGHAKRVLVATFPGHHVAEKEDGELKVYAIIDEFGAPVQSDLTLTTDRGPTLLRAMNRNAERFWAGR